jgi:hypothetical protein
MKRMLLIFSSLLFGSILGASVETPFEDFTVRILPEYDHPGILVLYTGNIKESSLPLHLEIYIQSETQTTLGVGHTDTTDKLLPLNTVEREDGRWITVNIIKNKFQIEFYFNPFSEGPERNIDFPIKLNHDIKDFHIAIQQPLSAEKFVLMEPGAESVSDEHGITYFRVHVPELNAGDTKTISLSYLNPSGTLSMNILQEMLGGTSGMGKIPSAKEKRSVSRYRLPTYEPLLVLGILSIVIGYLFWRFNKSTIAPVPSSDEKKSCIQCGNRIKPNDRFCSKCGTRINLDYSPTKYTNDTKT